MVSRNMYTGFSGVRSVAYVDDGYIKGKLSVSLQVLTDLKSVLKEEADLINPDADSPQWGRSSHLFLS